MTRSFAALFRSLGAKILLGGIGVLLITAIICVLVSRNIVNNQISDLMEGEMNGYLVQADSITTSVGDFWVSESFDKEALLRDLEKTGREHMRESKFYQTIPVIAAWDAVNEAADESGMEFHIARENPRGPDNIPRTPLERELHDELMRDPSKDSTFRIDRESGTIAIAHPVVMQESCMACHGDPANSPTGDGKDILGYPMENWKPGDRRGVYILSAPIERITEPTSEVLVSTIKWVLPFGIGFSALIGFLVHRFNFSISGMITQLRQGAEEVSHASGEVSNASQTLAEGASEQAASIEETTSSMEEMQDQVKHNAGVANTTAEATQAASHAADEGSESMRQLKDGVEVAGSSAEEMNRAMQEIQDSSQSISKIIKTIDEIAFQTNILALNAAVEAARAGEAGAGFAVVADEVRNLAGRAADAAGETTGIIEESISRIDNGVQANQAVVEQLQKVLERAAIVDSGLSSIQSGVNGVNASMTELGESASQQSAGIDEINRAMGQINEVTQGNAASAEQAASASEEMNAQSVELKNIVNRLEYFIQGANTEFSTGKASGQNSAGSRFSLPGE